MGFIIKAAAITHVGSVRFNNEDNFYLCGHIRKNIEKKTVQYTVSTRDKRFLAAVADGMGGEDWGEIASLLAVKALHPCSFEQVGETAQNCVMQANDQICLEMEKRGAKQIGSTLTALFIDDGKAVCCNIGDSRCYLLRNWQLTQLSTDHNKAKRMVELGVLTREQAARHPSRHELTQYLGVFPEEMLIQPAFSPVVTLQPGDVFLLCSDGLTDMVTEGEIAAWLAAIGTPEQKAVHLVRLALEGGGRDNITVLVVQVERERRHFFS